MRGEKDFSQHDVERYGLNGKQINVALPVKSQRTRKVHTGLCAYCQAGREQDGQCGNCGAGWLELIVTEVA